jgi:hypothetical protein
MYFLTTKDNKTKGMKIRFEELVKGNSHDDIIGVSNS